MTEQQESQTAEDRAEVAARDLADRGFAVTARAVREAAKVRMTVASEVARAWRDAQAEGAEVEVPAVPEDVRGRLDAIWTDAYCGATATVTPERDRRAAEVEELRGEVDALTATVADVEAERDEHAAGVEEEVQARTAAESDRDEAAARAARAADRAESVEAERDRLAAQVSALFERILGTGETEGD